MLSPVDILHSSIALYRKQSTLIVGYASWLLLTYAAFILSSFIANESVQFATIFFIQIADTLLYLWILNVLVIITLHHTHDQPLDLLTLPKRGWDLLMPIVWVSLIQGLIMLGGFLLVIIPGIVFTVWFAYAQEAVIIDGKRGIEALTASRELSRGRFFKVLWYTISIPLLILGLYFIVASGLTGTIATVLKIPFDTIVSETPPLWIDMIFSVGMIFVIPLLVMYSVMTYLQLKERKS